MFFDELVRQTGQFGPDVFQALWQLVWAGQITNDTLTPLRSLRAAAQRPARGRRRERTQAFRSRRASLTPGSEGRWSLLQSSTADWPDETTRQVAIATQIVERYGVVTRELAASEGRRGGFAGLYPVLKAMEEAGRLRRGYFVAGLGAAQFAAPGAEDRMRQIAVTADPERTVWMLAACDPANPYGTALKWPESPVPGLRPQRTANACVVLVEGQLIAYWNLKSQHLLAWIPDGSTDADRLAAAMSEALAAEGQKRPVQLQQINGIPAQMSPLRTPLQQAGFFALSRGLLCRPTPTYATHVRRQDQ